MTDIVVTCFWNSFLVPDGSGIPQLQNGPFSKNQKCRSSLVLLSTKRDSYGFVSFFQLAPFRNFLRAKGPPKYAAAVWNSSKQTVFFEIRWI